MHLSKVHKNNDRDKLSGVYVLLNLLLVYVALTCTVITTVLLTASCSAIPGSGVLFGWLLILLQRLVLVVVVMSVYVVMDAAAPIPNSHLMSNLLPNFIRFLMIILILILRVTLGILIN